MVRSQFTHHQSSSLDGDGSVKVARAIGCTPEVKRSTVTLEVELRESGRVSIVSTYNLDDAEYPFSLGNSSANDTALVVAELTACLTCITAIKKAKEGHSSPAFPRNVPKAHREVQNDLNAVCEELGLGGEMTARLSHRLGWECGRSCCSVFPDEQPSNAVQLRRGRVSTVSPLWRRACSGSDN